MKMMDRLCVGTVCFGVALATAVFLLGCAPDDPLLKGAMECPESIDIQSPSGVSIEAASASSGTGPLYINEFMASNVSTIMDSNNEYDDWVEIYNADPNNSINVGGMYLTDDLANPTKCQISTANPSQTTIPPHGVLLLWLDGQPAQGVLHINTKLSKSGEQLGLFASDGTTQIDSLTFGPQGDDVSFGRQPDGGANWVYFDKAYATPGSPNSALPPTNPPVFSSPGGLYTGTVSLSLSAVSPPPGAHIYYTLDGSEPANGASSTSYNYMFQETRNGANVGGTGPTETRYHVSFEYIGPITISSTTVVRARVYATNYMPSEIVTNTYIMNIDNPSNLAVVSVSSPPQYLWSNTKDPITGGILVMGPPPYGDTMWYEESNLMMDEWNRPGHVEFYEPDGTLGFSQDVEIRSGGSSTQLGPQKPMVLYAVGGERFDYRIFPDLDVDSFRIFVLHMSGDDWPYTHFRDGMVHGLLRDIDVDTQAYRPAVVYINGEYYGCMSIRERRNKDYVASHHDIDANDLDILDNYGYDQITNAFFADGEINEGDDLHYKAMINECFLNADNTPKDLTQAANYAAIKQRMEVDNFLDYWVTEVCISNTDWPGGNVRLWRPRVDNGRWRWILVDTDYSFNLPARNSPAYSTGVNYNMINHVTSDTSTSWYNHRATTYIFRRLLTNADFKSEFIRRIADHLNITFDATRVKGDIDQKKAAINSEMTRTGGQIDRWKNDRNPWTYTHLSMGGSYWMVPIGEPNTPTWPTWDASVQRIKDFADAHPAVLRSQVNTKWSLGGTVTLTFNVSPAEAGKIKVNRLILPIPGTGTWTGTYFKNISNQIAAMPSRGYRFQGWTGITGSSVASVTPTGNMTITATFAADASNDNSIVINEVNYNSDPNFQPQSWVELYNPHDFTIDVSGWQLKDSEDGNVYTFPPHTTIGPNDYLVLCENLIMFHSKFPNVEKCIGNFTFKLSNAGEAVRLFDPNGTLVDSVTYDDEFPWPTEPDGTGPTLELKNPGIDNAQPGAWAASTGNGTPGAVNSAYIPMPQVSAWAIGGPNGMGSEAWTATSNGYVEPRSYGIQKLRVTFDRAMDTSLTDPNSFRIVGLFNGDVSSLVTTVTWDSATQLTVVMASALPDGDTYTVTVSSDLQSTGGCPLGGDCDVSVSALMGDLSGNHEVGFEDYLTLSQNFGGANVGWTVGDLNTDGVVNFTDYLLLSQNYGKKDYP